MYTRAMRISALVLVSLSLSACGSNTPDCVVFNPAHATVNGVVDVGEMARGDVAEEVVEVETTGLEGSATTGVLIEVQTNCDDEDCTPTFECAPTMLEPGETVLCDVVDEIDGPACSWSCQLGLRATVLEDDVCEDALIVTELVGDHVEVAVGR